MNFWDNNNGSRNKLLLNVLVLAVAIVSFTKRDYNFDRVSFFERIMIDTLAPLQDGVASAQRDVGKLFEYYLQNVNASKKNKFLRQEVARLEGEVFKLQEVRRENLRLKELLDFGEELASRRVLAQIVAWDASSDFRILRINKGRNHGVQLQSTVVTSEGLVGYIYRLTNNYADVLTVLDSNNRVDGLIERTRSHGILEGMMGNRMTMKYVTRTEPVILGDQIVTSGLGNVYPKGLRVGSVSHIERQSYGITQKIEVSPSVDFGRLEEVVVLISQTDETRRQEWEALDDPHASAMRQGGRE